MEKNLLYITHEYPNDCGDTAFVRLEMEYVSAVFKKVVILSHGNPREQCIQVPENVTVLFLDKFELRLNLQNLLFCTGLLLKKKFWKEVFLIMKQRKSFLCIIHAAAFLRRALKESSIIKSIIIENDIDILYTFWYHFSTFACQLALEQLHISFKPVCTRVHGFDLYECQAPQQYQPYKRQMDERMCRVFFISKKGMEYYKERFATKTVATYRLSYLGTKSFRSFTPHEYTSTIRVLSVSYIYPVKRVHLIVDALSKCIKEDIKIAWTHIGDGTEMEHVSSLARNQLGDKALVSFNFLGAKTNEQVHEYYRHNTIDLFVNMSESEGLPVSMMEAMSYGVPVIAPDVGGIGEIVDDKNGWLISKDNCVDEFVSAIKEWNSMSVVEKQDKALAAYEKWSDVFDADKNYKVFASELQGV